MEKKKVGNVDQSGEIGRQFGRLAFGTAGFCTLRGDPIGRGAEFELPERPAR